MKRCSCLFLYLLFTIALLSGQELPKPMQPERLVNDFAGIFSTEQRDDLEQMLRAYNDSTSTQIYIVVVSDLQGYAVSDYATRLGQEWGIGQKEKDNGVLILLKPRIGNERGQVFIATGYGVEHILNDGRVGRIIDNYMIPYLQDGDYYTASKKAVEVIIQYLSGEFSADEESPSVWSFIGSILFFAVILYIIYKLTKNNNGGGNWGNGGSNRRYRGGGWTSGGSFGGWGGSGGSFGGGGGGSFGGGGAGRSF